MREFDSGVVLTEKCVLSYMFDMSACCPRDAVLVF